MRNGNLAAAMASGALVQQHRAPTQDKQDDWYAHEGEEGKGGHS
jgi:hypothetical protein